MAELFARCSREMDCPRDVVVWNYFDHEHVVGTHYKWYSGARVLAERDEWCLVYRWYTLPVLNIRASSLGFMALTGPGRIKSFQHGHLGLILDQDIIIDELGPERCMVTSEYRLEAPGWLAWLLTPVFPRVIQRWFDETWVEDARMRVRRHKMWKLGFQDFAGIPWINEKTEKPVDLKVEPYKVKLPIPKSTPITGPRGFTRAFKSSVDLGDGDGPAS